MELIDKARKALYNIDAPLISPEGKALDKALTCAQEVIEQLKNDVMHAEMNLSGMVEANKLLEEEITKLKEAMSGATIIANHSGSEIKQLREEIAHLNGQVALKDNDADFYRREANAANARAIQEEQKLSSLNEEFRKSLHLHREEIDRLRQERAQAEQERDELLEGLKEIAKSKNFAGVTLAVMARSIIAKIEGK